MLFMVKPPYFILPYISGKEVPQIYCNLIFFQKNLGISKTIGNAFVFRAFGENAMDI